MKNAIEEHIDRFKGDKIVLLDLHTTTATGGIFTLPTKDLRSLAIAETMHAPVITGVIERLRGTCIQYFVKKYPEKVIGLVFEAGQHEDPLSVNRTIAAITNCMRSIGMVDPRYIENRHDELLIEYSKNLPEIARLLYIHNVSPQDEFVMEPGYQNFQSVEKGEMLAKDKRGPIFAQKQGLILMPLYQNQGEDGYFLIEPANNKQVC